MATPTTFGKKAATAALVALTIGAGVSANAGAAQARNARNGVAAVGVLAAVAGLAIAASAAQAHQAPAYYGQNAYYGQDAYYDADYAAPAPVYYRQQRPVYEGRGFEPNPYGYRRHHRNRHAGYSETGFAYRGPVCKIKRQQVFDGYGYRWQKVQVCR